MEAKDKSLREKKRIVVKVGSSSITHDETGGLNFSKLEKLVRQLCDLRNQGRDVCLVSSGAIAVGRSSMGIKKRPEKTAEKQACAAVGQARLMMTYQRMFAEYHQTVGQVLLTKSTMSDNVSRLNAQNTFEQLFEMGVIPIVNENDTISTYEMEFGDNDTLSALVASLTSADLLILLSDIDGLYTDEKQPGRQADSGSDGYQRKTVTYGKGVHRKRRGDGGDGHKTNRCPDCHPVRGGYDYSQRERCGNPSRYF